MNLDEVLQTFIIESRELLQQMEDALLQIEQAPDDADLINAIFRAAHTIKGSAGLFGLDHVVSFTHVVESALDKVRDGELLIDSGLAALFLESCDFIGLLIDHIADGNEPGEHVAHHGNALLDRLKQYLSPGQAQQTAAAMPVQHEQTVESDGVAVVETDNWHISLRFGIDSLRNGMDPVAFLRYLNTLGTFVRIATLVDAIPSAEQMDPESCYVGFEISFKSDADKATIEGAFDFVREDSKIRIIPPRSKVSEYLGLIKDLPEQEMKLGEILIKCGTLTQAELDAALNAQSGPQTAARPIGEVLVESQLVQPAVVEAALEKQKQVKEHKAAENNFIRVDAAKLDQLINMVGELIIAGAGTNLIAQRVGVAELMQAANSNDIESLRARLLAVAEQFGELLESTSTMSRLVEEVRDSALNLRMVQIGGTFNRFQRVVRDVSKELGKDIRLVISGEETELDKTVVERIGDPLTHLVRNSMDHGIEPADVRTARGKPAHGTLKLNAFHDAGSIVIEVSDDGGGLNKDKILAKAIERGLVKPDQQLTEKEIYNLIFEAGFSTADAVSNLSGRGVGMDVVRRNIQALRGTVDIESKPGEGTRISIRLPLTLAIIDGFLVEVGKSAYVVPLDMVVECIELTEEDRQGMEETGRNYINLRGEVLPYLHMRDLFEVEGEGPQRANVVVVQYAGHKAGLVVDNLMGEYQTVIKPLGKVFSQIKGIGGFTILGSGEVALILDVPRLMQQATGGEQVATA